MNERQLRYAYAVMQERSFSKASERLHLSQPTLSDQVRQLELDLGFDLFYRSSLGVRPSLKGEIFLESVEQVLAEFAELKILAENLRGESGARLRIGISSCLAQTVVPCLMQGLLLHSQPVRPEIITATTRRIRRLVNQQRLDAGIIFEADGHSGQDQNPLAALTHQSALGQAEIIGLVPPDHVLAQLSGPVPFTKLAEFPLILCEPRTGYGRRVLAELAALDVSYHLAADCDDGESLKYMVGCGAGVGILPRLAAGREIENGTFAALSFDPPCFATVSLVQNAGQKGRSEITILQNGLAAALAETKLV